MNVPNVNPTVSAPPAAPRPAAPKPIGPVMTERKVQAARKSIVTVDARLYGVKPQALSKYMNDMIKSSPFNGIIYNKTMFTIAKNNESHLKQISAITDKNHRALLGFNADFMAAHEETIKHLESLKAEYKKPNATTHKIEELINGEEEDRRRAIYAKREKQPGENGTDNTEIIKELTIENANLEKILKEGEQQAKDAKKTSSGGLLGFIKNSGEFIWDMLGSVPGGRLIGGIAAAIGVGAILKKMLPNTIHELYEAIVPQELKDFVKDIKIMVNRFKTDPLKAIGDTLASTISFLYDMFKTQFIDPVVYKIEILKSAGQAFFTHAPWDAAGRDAAFKKLTEGLVEPSKITFDVGKAIHDILVKGEYSPKDVKIYQKSEDEKHIAQTVGFLPNVKTENGQPIYDPSQKNTKPMKLINLPESSSLPTYSDNKTPRSIQDIKKVIDNVNKYNDDIEAAAKKHHLDPNFLRAILAQESGGNPDAEGTLTSSGRARGIAQFVPGTARQYKLKVDRQKGIDERNDPHKSIEAAGKYLEHLKELFGDDAAAAGAYNAGEGAFAKIIRGEKNMPSETANYIPNIKSWMKTFSGTSPEINALNDTKNAIEQTNQKNADDINEKNNDTLSVLNDISMGINKLVNKNMTIQNTTSIVLGAVTA